MRCWLALFFLFLSPAIVGCTGFQSGDQALNSFRTETGLNESSRSLEVPIMEKRHRGYEVLFRPQMGDVWGRYAARMAMGEVGRELGIVGQFLTGSHRSGVGSVAGSPLDRLLSRVIGQPLTFYIILKHQKPNAPRVDILSDFSTVTPSDPQPKVAAVNWRAGSIYSSDKAIVQRILANPLLVKRLENYRSQYIRLDESAVTFIFAGSEPEWSSTMRENGGYSSLVNSIIDSLADIADAAK